jgi:zinc protease
MASAPAPGAVVATKTFADLGVTEWTLKNGVRVVVKSTDFKADEVRLSAFAPGGTSIVPDADFDSANFAGAVVGQGGLAGFDATTLKKLLAGKVASVNASIGELDESVSGTASPDDLPTLFELTHLTFTAPRRDEGAFASWRASELERTKNKRLSPEIVFHEDLGVFFSQNHRRRRPITPEVIEKVDLDKALAFYKSRFADASGFTFVLVGNLDLDKTKTLAETYLGSLPAKGHKEAWKDVHVTHPPGVAKKEVKQGTEPKSSVWLTFHGPEKYSRDAKNDLRMLGEVLRIRLREVLREDMGGVYGVGVQPVLFRRPIERYTFTVSFGCAPDNVDKLEKAVFAEIKALEDSGIGADYVTKIKEQRRRAHETELRDNGYWLGELREAYTYGDDPRLMLDYGALVDKVSSERIQKAAKKYLSGRQYALAELRPASP